MRYLGGKSKIAPYIAQIIQQRIDMSGTDTYIEPFVGGCNIMEYIECKNRYGYDLNKYLIAFLKYVQDGGEVLDEVPRELYNRVKDAYYKGAAEYADYYYGMIGFLASYNGKFFQGGYAPSTDKRDFYQEMKRNVLKQVPYLQDVIFDCRDYRAVSVENAVIYCDPPYANTTRYLTGTDLTETFDSEEFWETVRKWSKNNIVLVSEEQAPSDFECIWQKTVTRSLNVAYKKSRVERLFMLR